MMQVKIHDVGHGHCAVVTAPDGMRMMIDCGCDGDRKWWPSVHYRGEFFDTLVIQNLDEDHVEDLPWVLSGLRFGSFFSNPTVGADELRSLKVDGMRLGVTAAHDLLRRYQPGAIGQLPLNRGGGMQSWAMWNRYGVDVTNSTNDLSVVTYIRYGTFAILFTGDLEASGWRQLLRWPEFRAILPTVKVLIASHHGRANGCCAEAFELLKPEVVIFSDDEMQFESQETHGFYRTRTIGIPDYRTTFDPVQGYGRKHILTTRRDGSMKIGVFPDGRYLVNTERGGPALPPPIGLPLGLRYLP